MLKLNIVCRCAHRVRCASLGFDNDDTSKKTRFPLENYDFFTFFSLLIRHNFVRHQTLFSKNYRSAHKTMTNKHYADVKKPTTLFLNTPPARQGLRFVLLNETLCVRNPPSGLNKDPIQKATVRRIKDYN